MSSRVTKSLPFLVVPSEATSPGGGTLCLTSMDRALASLPMAALLVFEHPIDQPAETIRRALSCALVPYYPMAGRLTADARIACTGEGVAFAGASATCTLREARLSGPRPLVTAEDLTLTYAGQYSDDPPLLLVQVTEFSCGGFVVGVTWDHVATDGVGMVQFLQAVGEFARGRGSPSSSPSVVVRPVRVDAALPELPPPVVTMADSMVRSKHNDFPCSYITAPMGLVNRIKDEFRRCSGGQAAPCTAFRRVHRRDMEVPCARHNYKRRPP
ncbi:hypothetical protein BS78_06G046800 [Paspalum vaginatum]|nr:hypothetical protein BS78_06G046800 [Paspalum vaginatum]